MNAVSAFMEKMQLPKQPADSCSSTKVPESRTSSQGNVEDRPIVGTVKHCSKCAATYTGFGPTCSTCRRVGNKGSFKQCIHCGQYFNGFGDICTDCAGCT